MGWGVVRWSLPDQSASSKRRAPDTGMNDLPSSLATSNKRRHSQDTGFSRNSSLISWAWVNQRYLGSFILLTKHKQRQRNLLAIIRFFFHFRSPHTPALTSELYSSGCYDPYGVIARSSYSGDPFAAWRMVSSPEGHPSSGLPLRSGRSSWMVRAREWMQVCAAS